MKPRLWISALEGEGIWRVLSSVADPDPVGAGTFTLADPDLDTDPK